MVCPTTSHSVTLYIYFRFTFLWLVEYSLEKDVWPCWIISLVSWVTSSGKRMYDLVWFYVRCVSRFGFVRGLWCRWSLSCISSCCYRTCIRPLWDFIYLVLQVFVRWGSHGFGWILFTLRHMFFCKRMYSWFWVDFIYVTWHIFLQENVSIHDFGWILFTLHYKSVREWNHNLG